MNIKLDIPEKFFEGEERSGYYVSPLMKKVWAVQLDLLAEFSRVCGKHNIKWWMDAGTLLGAVRHKGFVPWDHDADVMMLRDDYEQLCNIASEEFCYPYRLINIYNSPTTYTGSFLRNESTTMIHSESIHNVKSGLFKSDLMKQCSFGIGIDVFVVDMIPDNEREIMKMLKKVKMYALIAQKIWNCKECYLPHNKLWKRPLKSLLHSIMKHISINYRYFVMKCIDIEKSYADLETSHVAKLCMMFDPNFIIRRVWDRSWFDDVVYLPFEMLTLPAPSGWENILRTFYGNWHEFVIRKTPQGVIDPENFFYDPERPYTYYTQEGHIPE